jgi:hypothetical protein
MPQGEHGFRKARRKPRENAVSDRERNLRIAESIGAQFAWDGQTFQEGDYVAVLDGRIVAVAKNPDDAISALRALDPDPKRGMVIEVSHPTVDVVR